MEPEIPPMLYEHRPLPPSREKFTSPNPFLLGWPGCLLHQQNTAEQPGSLPDFPAQPREQLHYKTSPPVPTLNPHKQRNQAIEAHN